MGQRLTSFKNPLSNIKLYKSEELNPLIIIQDTTYITLEDIQSNQERYKLFYYSESYVHEGNWTQFVWVFDSLTNSRKYISKLDLGTIKEMFNPF